MIISHKYKFIFIKTMKTAGTSIEVFLSQHCSDRDIVTPIYPHIHPHRARNHKGFWNPASEIYNNNGQPIRAIIANVFRRERYYNHIPAYIIKQRTNKKIWDTYFKFCVERNPWDKTLSHFYMMKRQNGQLYVTRRIHK